MMTNEIYRRKRDRRQKENAQDARNFLKQCKKEIFRAKFARLGGESLVNGPEATKKMTASHQRNVKTSYVAVKTASKETKK